MKRFMFSATLAVAALAMALVAAKARAAEERPLMATTVNSQVAYDGNGILVASGTGTATHLGDVEVSAVVNVKKKDVATGRVTLTASNGDSITIEFEQVRDPAAELWVGDYWITGGTGKFVGAGGSGTVTRTYTGVGEYDGTIIY